MYLGSAPCLEKSSELALSPGGSTPVRSPAQASLLVQLGLQDKGALPVAAAKLHKRCSTKRWRQSR
jgi:hypothetical protein